MPYSLDVTLFGVELLIFQGFLGREYLVAMLLSGGLRAFHQKSVSPHAIKFRALFGANLVMQHHDFWPQRNLGAPSCGSSRQDVVRPKAQGQLFFTLVAGPRRSLRLKLSETRVHEP